MKVYLLNIVGNIVAKGDIAHYDKFILLPQCFQKLNKMSQDGLKVEKG